MIYTNRSLTDDLAIVGIKHFALKVPSLEKARDFFYTKGFVTSIAIHAGKTGIRYFFIKDPNNIFLEIVEDNRNILD